MAELVTALQNMVSRRISTFDPIALSVTQLQAGDAVNVIPASASLGATVRTLSQESLDIVRAQSKQLARASRRLTDAPPRWISKCSTP
nr:peptidase dimerization domain-containing protein [Brevibacterium aurantiacum]